MTQEQQKYEEWLTTIANTRLLFNTVSELEDFLDAPSIHSNGIKRCFISLQRLRSAYRDLLVEVDSMTHGSLFLDDIMTQYRDAWIFFRNNLARRSDPSAVALELLRFCYPPHDVEKIAKSKLAIFEQVNEQNISVPFLVLMLLKIIPGYDSKVGDVTDMPQLYKKAMDFLLEYTQDGSILSVQPSINLAQQEENKSRIMLLYHFKNIISTFIGYSDQENLYETSSLLKENTVDLDIDGFWSEREDNVCNTNFWQIQCLTNSGGYFAIRWSKDSCNRLVCVRYTMFLFQTVDGALCAYMLHPCAIMRRIKGENYKDRDQVWYKTLMPDSPSPSSLHFCRVHSSKEWSSFFKLTRITNDDTIRTYSHWLDTLRTENQYQQFEYTLRPSIYAITHDHIYIFDHADEMFFQVPRDSDNGFDRISLNDTVGIMEMNGKRYLVFDELMLYIQILKSNLQEYGIKKVENVE